MATSSPMLARNRLGVLIRNLRSQAQLTHVALGQKIGTSQTTLSQVENGHQRLTDEQMETLIASLDITEGAAEELRELQGAATELGWWEESGGLVSKTIERLVGFEAGATKISTYEDAYVPVLLQTPEYARASITAGEPYLTRSGNIRALVEFRTRRQQRLDDPNLSYIAIMNEGALLRPVGGPGVMRQQIRHIIEADKKYKASIEFLLLPLSAGENPAMGQSITIMSFPDEQDPEIVFMDYVAASGFATKPNEVRSHAATFGVALRLALRVEESIARLEEIEKSYSTR